VFDALSRYRNAFVEVVATSTIGMLILLGTAFQRRTIFAGDFMFLQFYLSFYLLPPLLRLPWPVGIVFSFVVAATANLSAYIRDGTPDYFVDRCLIVWATASACSYFQEKESRMVFQELKSSDLLRQGLQGEVEMQETLVHLIVPETVAMNVLEKYKSTTAKTLTQLLGELCVAGLRIEQAGEGAPIQNLESIRLRLDHAILNGSRRSHSAELIVQVLQTLGDELYLGGPLYRQKRQSDAVPATSAAFLEGLYEEGNESGLWVALKTLLFALEELKGKGMQFSAAIQIGSGIASVTGRVRPTFTVLGYAPNVVSALLEATPQQSVVTSAAVGDLVTNQRDPDLQRAGIRLTEATPWALRGLGLIRVHYIHFNSNVNTEETERDRPAKQTN
jgi:class 3 adenylate cyclase